MIVRMLRNPAAAIGCGLLEGQISEVTEAMGRKLIALGIAVRLDTAKDPPTILAVPEPPAIAESESPAIQPEPLPRPAKAPVLRKKPHSVKETDNG